MVASSAETMGALNTGFDTVNLHRLTVASANRRALNAALPSMQGHIHSACHVIERRLTQ